MVKGLHEKNRLLRRKSLFFEPFDQNLGYKFEKLGSTAVPLLKTSIPHTHALDTFLYYCRLNFNSVSLLNFQRSLKLTADRHLVVKYYCFYTLKG